MSAKDKYKGSQDKFFRAMGDYLVRFERLVESARVFICSCLTHQGLEGGIARLLIQKNGNPELIEFLPAIYGLMFRKDRLGLKNLKKAAKKFGEINAYRNSLVHSEKTTLFGIPKEGQDQTVGIEIKKKGGILTGKLTTYTPQEIEQKTEEIISLTQELWEATDWIQKKGSLEGYQWTLKWVSGSPPKNAK